MSQSLAVSEGAIRSHKCCLCGHFLSVAPIMATGLEPELYKCGRCHHVEVQTFMRLLLFEDVAQHLSFPCSFAPCERKVRWGRVQDHEKDCRYRTMKCPVYYHNCAEVVPVDDLSVHFMEKHRKNLKTVGSTWDTTVNLDYVFLVEVDCQQFLVYILHLDQFFSVGVLALQTSKYTKFNVQLINTADNFYVSFTNLPVVRYDERSHCYMCIRKKCNEPHHPCSKKNGNKIINLDSFTSKIKASVIDSVKGQDGELSYCVTLIADETAGEFPNSLDEEDEREEGAQAVGGVPSPLNLHAVRKALTCPYCMTYMAAPIFTCAIGHTICNVCRPRLDQCPTCAGALGSARNYTLEDLTEDVGVPCQYDTKGCNFVGRAAKMYIHEMECAFSSALRE